jgi:hypothetical protein
LHREKRWRVRNPTITKALLLANIVLAIDIIRAGISGIVPSCTNALAFGMYHPEVVKLAIRGSAAKLAVFGTAQASLCRIRSGYQFQGRVLRQRMTDQKTDKQTRNPNTPTKLDHCSSPSSHGYSTTLGTQTASVAHSPIV